jgi:hypothetical protein
MDVNTSPLLTKIGYGYMKMGQGLKIEAKHIDYTQNIIVDMVYQDPAGFMQSVDGISITT